MNYVIAYDIADPARLRRVARFLERRALRCQKSVFLFKGSAEAVEALLDELAERLSLADDVVQAWALTQTQPRLGLIRGAALNLYPAALVLDGPDRHLAGEQPPP